MARPPYDALPDAICVWVDASLGSPVVTWTGESGGFSPGVAARVGCANGTRAFVKAVSAEANPVTPGMHRTEARVTAALPPQLGSPRLIDVYDDGTWVALLLEEVDGRPPAVPWVPEDLAAALRALDRLADVPGLPALPTAFDVLGGLFVGWRTLAADPPADLHAWQRDHLDELVAYEMRWPEAGAGDRLVHLDVRGDNMLVTADGEAVLLDWPWAATGNPLLDVVGFIPSALLDGAGDPEALLRSTAAGRVADPADVTALVVAVSGLMERGSRQPPQKSLERIRDFQRAQAETCGRWLRQRTGW